MFFSILDSHVVFSLKVQPVKLTYGYDTYICKKSGWIKFSHIE